ncbi:hypothetical protein IRJ41_018015, partial [Triplophysa rosa]
GVCCALAPGDSTRRPAVPCATAHRRLAVEDSFRYLQWHSVFTLGTSTIDQVWPARCGTGPGSWWWAGHALWQC